MKDKLLDDVAISHVVLNLRLSRHKLWIFFLYVLFQIYTESLGISPWYYKSLEESYRKSPKQQRTQRYDELEFGITNLVL